MFGLARWREERASRKAEAASIQGQTAALQLALWMVIKHLPENERAPLVELIKVSAERLEVEAFPIEEAFRSLYRNMFQTTLQSLITDAKPAASVSSPAEGASRA